MSDPLPAPAGNHATRQGALDLGTLSVIGVMQASNGTAALLRSPEGEIARVLVGQEAFGVFVTAIGDDLILLTDRTGRTQSLALPEG